MITLDLAYGICVDIVPLIEMLEAVDGVSLYTIALMATQSSQLMLWRELILCNHSTQLSTQSE